MQARSPSRDRVVCRPSYSEIQVQIQARLFDHILWRLLMNELWLYSCIAVREWIFTVQLKGEATRGRSS